MVLLAARGGWVREIDPREHFRRVLDLLPGMYVFVKNRRSETRLTSRSILARYGMTDEHAMLGMTDYDLKPRQHGGGVRLRRRAHLRDRRTDPRPLLSPPLSHRPPL